MGLNITAFGVGAFLFGELIDKRWPKIGRSGGVGLWGLIPK
jgi:hypothetical protein